MRLDVLKTVEGKLELATKACAISPYIFDCPIGEKPMLHVPVDAVLVKTLQFKRSHSWVNVLEVTFYKDEENQIIAHFHLEFQGKTHSDAVIDTGLLETTQQLKPEMEEIITDEIDQLSDSELYNYLVKAIESTQRKDIINFFTTPTFKVFFFGDKTPRTVALPAKPSGVRIYGNSKRR